MILIRHLRSVLVAIMAALLMTAAVHGSETPTVEELLNKTDDLMRGDSSRGKLRMKVKTARWERELVMSVLSKGEERTLIQILAPAKEKGTATLKVEDNIWNYLPKVDRTIKVPGSMMSGSWMGSHFTNDDLVKDSRYADDYDCRFTAMPNDAGESPYVISCLPRPDAPVVWGEVVVTVRSADQLVEKVEFFDERETLVRTMTYSEITDIGDRSIPLKVQVIPADKPEEYTEVYYEDLTFGVEISDRTFSLQYLRR